jgi:hypothetical protein
LLLGVGEHFFTVAKHGFGGRMKNARGVLVGDSIGAQARQRAHLESDNFSHSFRVSGVSSVGKVTESSA